MKYKQNCEGIVLINEEIQNLRYRNIVRGSVVLRSSALPGDVVNMDFVEGEDFVIDYSYGTIRRASGSRILNWTDHVMYGKTNFDHRIFDDFSNKKYTVYTDYEFMGNAVAANDKLVINRNKFGFIKKMEKCQAVKYLVYGDSISAGAEVSKDELMYFNRFAANMRALYPSAQIEVINKSCGGEDSSGGLKRLDVDVLAENPDLITIGYGMNDQNRWETRNQVPVEVFKENIKTMIIKIKENTQADIILITPCIPNPLWMHTSGDAPKYSEAIKEVGKLLDVYVADLQNIWLGELKAGKSHESLLVNNINHPNDYGHWLYFRALKEVM